MSEHERARKRRDRKRRRTAAQPTTKIMFEEDEGSQIISSRGRALATYAHTIDHAMDSIVEPDDKKKDDRWGNPRAMELNVIAGGASWAAGELAAAAGMFILEGAAMLAGVLATYATMANDMTTADRQTDLSSEAAGVRIGLAALSQLSIEKEIPPLSLAQLGTYIQSRDSLAREWNRQVRYAGASGPDLVTTAMRRGLDQVVRITFQALSKAHNHRQAELGEQLSAEEQCKLRRVIYKGITQEAAKQAR
ncbi:hypothetical protein K2Z83_12315 [Oscillochloris sp. ZM17-4]|uniref:hypothetical protein n=1 Tax=Oscillochloris sp. ZM17-4 TaxID=2866714 RepID=UPI001C73D131|nr:hypothetical protein [Oscillochloris sp. ZM17-4]MBX0328461.1 hypothetical protein [Oscillochloris sp. ZM17-4]